MVGMEHWRKTMMTRFSSLLASALILLLSVASAGAASPEPAALFEAKTVADRDSTLTALEVAAPSDPASAYAAGAGQFFTALEILAGCRCRTIPIPSR
jgi:hypothetical protein